MNSRSCSSASSVLVRGSIPSSPSSSSSSRCLWTTRTCRPTPTRVRRDKAGGICGTTRGALPLPQPQISPSFSHATAASANLFVSPRGRRCITTFILDHDRNPSVVDAGEAFFSPRQTGVGGVFESENKTESGSSSSFSAADSASDRSPASLPPDASSTSAPARLSSVDETATLVPSSPDHLAVPPDTLRSHVGLHSESVSSGGGASASDAAEVSSMPILVERPVQHQADVVLTNVSDTAGSDAFAAPAPEAAILEKVMVTWWGGDGSTPLSPTWFPTQAASDTLYTVHDYLCAPCSLGWCGTLIATSFLVQLGVSSLRSCLLSLSKGATPDGNPQRMQEMQQLREKVFKMRKNGVETSAEMYLARMEDLLWQNRYSYIAQYAPNLIHSLVFASTLRALRRMSLESSVHLSFVNEHCAFPWSESLALPHADASFVYLAASGVALVAYSQATKSVSNWLALLSDPDRWRAVFGGKGQEWRDRLLGKSTVEEKEFAMRLAPPGLAFGSAGLIVYLQNIQYFSAAEELFLLSTLVCKFRGAPVFESSTAFGRNYLNLVVGANPSSEERHFLKMTQPEAAAGLLPASSSLGGTARKLHQESERQDNHNSSIAAARGGRNVEVGAVNRSHAVDETGAAERGRVEQEQRTTPPEEKIPLFTTRNGRKFFHATHIPISMNYSRRGRYKSAREASLFQGKGKEAKDESAQAPSRLLIPLALWRNPREAHRQFDKLLCGTTLTGSERRRERENYRCSPIKTAVEAWYAKEEERKKKHQIPARKFAFASGKTLFGLRQAILGYKTQATNAVEDERRMLASRRATTTLVDTEEVQHISARPLDLPFPRTISCGA
ncbi:unnamed protein product [Amoebophrya sp. A25]|nr:unnamed protein product [Amoebophrya sp. A25]|eukprot:GSA25T00012129001.1